MEFAGDEQRRGLRTGFDRAAEDYQRTRPVCPPQLFDDLIWPACNRETRVTEIGCGTGQATVPLAERELAVTAVELGPELAAVARRRLTGFLAAEVVTSSFEDWQPQDAMSMRWWPSTPRTGSTRGFVTPSPTGCCDPGGHGRGGMSVGTASGRRTLLDGRAGRL